MAVIARAPGKAVILGEYAVLDGATALVMAVDRRCHARLEAADGPVCRLTASFPDPATATFRPAEPSGIALVDAFLARTSARPPWPAWAARLDSSALYADGKKLGLGSSAAALVAFAGAWSAAAGAPRPALADLVAVHRAFQGGAGSGLDVAAAYAGGAIEFALDPDSAPLIGSVPLPNSVGFAGIFAGSSASTPGLVAHYRRWASEDRRAAGRLLAELGGLADRGRAAASGNDGAALVAAIAEYGEALEALGTAMGADLVTSEHREIGRLARRFGVAYKVSGAGGGDLGLAASIDDDALAAFATAAGAAGFRAVALAIDESGLVVEELAE
jgi:phosphomevalonate kinase